jgi:hypothetical protein
LGDAFDQAVKQEEQKISNVVYSSDITNIDQDEETDEDNTLTTHDPKGKSPERQMLTVSHVGLTSTGEMEGSPRLSQESCSIGVESNLFYEMLLIKKQSNRASKDSFPKILNEGLEYLNC